MDERLVKVVVGLALESAFVNRRHARILASIYSDPDLERVRKLHDALIVSGDPYDREVAIWLEPALDLGPLRSDPSGIVREMREMEVVLYSLITRAGEAYRDVNNWLNFIANAAQSIEDGFWIDAKILLSRALGSSMRPSVEVLKTDPSLRYEVDVLQRATASYFREVKGYPLRLSIPEDRLDEILKVQEIMLDLMDIHYGEEGGNHPEITGPPIHRLSTAVRYLMDGNREIEAAEREVRLALEHLETMLEDAVEPEGPVLMRVSRICAALRKTRGQLGGGSRAVH
ncbi:MAG: hypothetical protein ACE5OO_01480 [Candidatus Bathyarchaeia archaeon]